MDLSISLMKYRIFYLFAIIMLSIILFILMQLYTVILINLPKWKQTQLGQPQNIKLILLMT